MDVYSKSRGGETTHHAVTDVVVTVTAVRTQPPTVITTATWHPIPSDCMGTNRYKKTTENTNITKETGKRGGVLI